MEIFYQQSFLMPTYVYICNCNHHIHTIHKKNSKYTIYEDLIGFVWQTLHEICY